MAPACVGYTGRVDTGAVQRMEQREGSLSMVKQPGPGGAVLACLFSVWAWAAGAVAQVPVAVAAVIEESVWQELQLTGSVTAERSARLSLATAGLVQSLAVDAGSRVAAGDELLQLDDELARLHWQAGQAAAREARLQWEDARRRLEEGRRLLPQKGIAETAVRDLESEVAQTEAALARAEAEAQRRAALLDRHRLRAPFGGIVADRHTDMGEWVTPGTPVFELVGLEDLRLEFAVAEDVIAGIQAGAETTYRLGKTPRQAWLGQVDSLVPVADPGARTFLLRILPKGERPPFMLPGMSVSAELRLDTGRRALTVPRDALLRYPDGRVVVWTVEPGEEGAVAREKPVEPGLTFDGRVEVRGDLAVGERVVVRGNEALSVGQRVAPFEQRSGS